MQVYVLTNVELGWDCVCGVFSSIPNLAGYIFRNSDLSKKKLNKKYNTIEKIKTDMDDAYVIHEKYVE